MGDFTQRVSLTQQALGKNSPDRLHEVGTIAETADGRVYKYAKAGGANLAAGKVNVGAAIVANHTNVAVAANVAVGAKTIRVTVGATAVTAGQYDGGHIVVNDGAGVGQVFRIVGTPSIAASGSGDLQIEEIVRTALVAATTKVSLRPSLYSGAIVHPGGGNAFAANGVSSTLVPAQNFYWSQVGGVASVLSDGIVLKGDNAKLTVNAVPGALQTATVLAASAGPAANVVAVALEATVDTKYYPVYLRLAY